MPCEVRDGDLEKEGTKTHSAWRERSCASRPRLRLPFSGSGRRFRTAHECFLRRFRLSPTRDNFVEPMTFDPDTSLSILSLMDAENATEREQLVKEAEARMATAREQGLVINDPRPASHDGKRARR